MNPTLELILTILLVVIGVVMIVMILMQNSKSEGLSASLSGAAETFFGKNKGGDINEFVMEYLRQKAKGDV